MVTINRLWLLRLLNNAKQLTWFVILAGVLILLIGFCGFIEGPIGYPSFVGSRFIEKHQSISTELIGIGLTVLIIDTATRWREIKENKHRLVREMGSNFYGTSCRAVDELRAHGWLMDGSLKEANLLGANLQGANLGGAHLYGVNLRMANLEEANLYGAELEQAILGSDPLNRAVTWVVSTAAKAGFLQGANLESANLTGASSDRTSRVKVGQLSQAKSLRGARLPDGTKLPDDDTWQAEFQGWMKTVKTDEEGYIVVTSLTW